MQWEIYLAQSNDEAAILELIRQSAKTSNIIPREKIDWQNFLVAKTKEKVIGCIGYKVWEEILPEVISTIVLPEYRGKNGIGQALVLKLLYLLKKRQFHYVFCLTAVPKFFSKFSFREVPIGVFPGKILADCRHCPRNLGGPHNPKCNDVALFREL